MKHANRLFISYMIFIISPHTLFLLCEKILRLQKRIIVNVITDFLLSLHIFWAKLWSCEKVILDEVSRTCKCLKIEIVQKYSDFSFRILLHLTEWKDEANIIWTYKSSILYYLTITMNSENKNLFLCASIHPSIIMWVEK